MKRIFPYLKKYKKEAFLAPLFKMLEASFELLVPIIIKQLVDIGIKNADMPYIMIMCGLLIAFCIVGFISSVVAQYFSAKAAVGVSKDLRHDMYKKAQSFTYSDLDKVGVSNMITQMTSSVNQVQTGINMTLRLLLRSPFIVIGAMILAFSIDVKCALIFAIAIPLLLVVIFAIMLITIPLFKKVQKRLELVLKSTRQSLSGARVIRAFCTEDEQIEKFDDHVDRLTILQKFTTKISVLLNPATYIIINVAIVILIYTGALRLEAGILSLGAILALYDYMSQILIELIKFVNFVITLTKAMAGAAKVEEYMSLGSPQTIENCKTDSKKPYLSFENVSFSYSNDRNVLKNITFSANFGETVGIIGGTGSGKSSLVNLIPRFYDATSGHIFIDGMDVRSYEPEALRSKIGLVPQQAVLFSGSIRENIKWGKLDASDEKIIEAITLAQGADILSAKGSLDAILTEGGKNLSGGQRQRLTIARALVRKPKILILDDSASALDYKTDASLRLAIREQVDAPLTFIVSQRTASVMYADKIIVLDDGVAVGIGSHEQLLSSCEVYKEIYSSQLGGGEKNA